MDFEEEEDDDEELEEDFLAPSPQGVSPLAFLRAASLDSKSSSFSSASARTRTWRAPALFIKGEAACADLRDVAPEFLAEREAWPRKWAAEV